jgi:hypothetical protein
MNDAAWLADLVAHGWIRGSFVAPAPIQVLRDLTPCSSNGLPIHADESIRTWPSSQRLR